FVTRAVDAALSAAANVSGQASRGINADAELAAQMAVTAAPESYRRTSSHLSASCALAAKRGRLRPRSAALAARATCKARGGLGSEIDLFGEATLVVRKVWVIRSIEADLSTTLTTKVKATGRFRRVASFVTAGTLEAVAEPSEFKHAWIATAAASAASAVAERRGVRASELSGGVSLAAEAIGVFSRKAALAAAVTFDAEGTRSIDAASQLSAAASIAATHAVARWLK